MKKEMDFINELFSDLSSSIGKQMYLCLLNRDTLDYKIELSQNKLDVYFYDYEKSNEPVDSVIFRYTESPIPFEKSELYLTRKNHKTFVHHLIKSECVYDTYGYRIKLIEKDHVYSIDDFNSVIRSLFESVYCELTQEEYFDVI